tara:strand:- start:904 stop:1086 length:183 start_codon:yes stop_codon:yes gene_type:complete
MNPKIRLYIYIDDVFHYKTDIIEQSFQPIFDLRIKVNLPEPPHDVRIDVYDASDLSKESI